jgi:hypothetical protein
MLRLIWEKVPLFALVAASCVITWYAQKQGGALQSLVHFPLPTRLANALVTCAVYLRKMFLPIDLAAYYPHPRDSLTVAQVAGAGVLLLITTAVALGLAWRRPYLLVGWLWYLGTLVPVLGLVQQGDQAMADRFTYVPLVGIFLALTWGFADVLTLWRPAKVIIVPVAAVLLVFCLILTGIQVTFWHDSYSLWAHANDVTSNNVVANLNLGVYFQGQHDVVKAQAFYREVLRIEPDNIQALDYLGMLLLSQGRYAEARDVQTTFLQIKAAASAEAGRWDEAIPLQRRALENSMAAKQPELAERIEARLRRYEQHQP